MRRRRSSLTFAPNTANPSGHFEKGADGPLAEEHLHRTSLPGREIILLGTAHVSRDSVRLVEETIVRERPDAVCIELCPSRYAAMIQRDAWQQMDIAKVIRQKRSSLLLMQLLLASFQKRIADRFQVIPGEEMLRAASRAEEVGASVILADREIRVTLLRAWRGMGFFMKWKLLTKFILSLFSTEEITEEEIERLKQHDVLEVALQTIGEEFPTLKKSLIDERDQYLAYEIAHTPAARILAVVGAGHVPGILRNLDRKIDRDALNEIPPAGLTTRVLGWAIPLLVLGFIAAGFFTSGSKAGLSMITWWTVITALGAAVGAVLLLAHPLTIAASALAAPFTTLHPLIAAGWVAGLVEATVRKPQVKDFLSLPTDIATVKGFFRNKITRILLLVALVNLTTSIGTFISIPVIMRLL
jgi:pheromone shutdown-related protein TraB